MRLVKTVAALFFVAALCQGAEPAEPARPNLSSGSGIVSPTVVATWIVNEVADGKPRLELLVLWRGAPGWFMKEIPEGSSSVQSGGRDARGLVFEELVYGDLRLRVEFDPRELTARLLGRVVAVESDKVVLVDDVGGEQGPIIAGSRRVDPEFPASPAEIHVILRRSPELVEFLQCDARVPDSKVQPMFDAMCARVRS
jgi:hypothetical protein